MFALVTTPLCPLLTEPRPGASLADEALLGMAVEWLEDSGNYVRIRTPYRYEGWAPRACLNTDKAEDWLARERLLVYARPMCDALQRPAFDSPTVTRMPRGAAVVPVGEAVDGWQKLLLPDGQTAYTKCSNLSEDYKNAPSLPEEALRQRLVETAMLYLGTAYRWGGKTPLGIDCSGLVSMAYLLNGIVIYRDAKPMEGFPIRPIPRQSARPGDLLYFPGHVAMALDEGRILHATGQTGADGVVIQSLHPDSPLYRPDLDRSLVTAGTYF